MYFFLLCFFLIYGTANLYFGSRVGTYRPDSPWKRYLLPCFLLFQTAAPVLARILEYNGLHTASAGTAWIAYCWMGFLFLFVVCSLPQQIINAILRIWSRERRRQPRFFSSPLPPILAATIVFGYGLLEAGSVGLTTVSWRPNRPGIATDRPLRIALIGDLHLGVLVGSRRLDTIIALIDQAQPDLLLCSGDLVDGYMPERQLLAQKLAAISPPLGKYAVTGNHEFYSGIQYALDFLDDAGFITLRNRAITLPGRVNLIGVDDPMAVAIGGVRPVAAGPLTKATDPRLPTILLKHQPVLTRDLETIDLQLSGHTHGGQIFPFGRLVQLRYPQLSGLRRVAATTWLLVTRGAGTWGPPIRVLAAPEVVVIDLPPLPVSPR